MVELKFSGLGTHWQIIVDDDHFPSTLKKEIVNQATTFEKKFSRFLTDSEIGQINIHGPGEYQISDELVEILKFGMELSKNSDGHFNPLIGKILSAYGYDESLNLKSKINLPTTSGTVKLRHNKLYLTGDAQLDLGGWGKGCLIDQLFGLISQNAKYFIINGGGDFRATSKKDGASWRIALEHPLNKELAIGVVELKNSALANSGSDKRRMGEFHHLIDFQTGKPVDSFLASHVFAPNATIADGLATALFISPKEIRDKLSTIYPVEYLLVTEKLEMKMSAGFILKSE